MEKIYQNIIEEINILFDNYNKELRNNIFENEEDFNENLNIKTKIKNIIIIVNNDNTLSNTEKNIIVNNLIKLMAENTGCVEDSKITENILNDLKNKGIIRKENIEYFYENENIGRWK